MTARDWLFLNCQDGHDWVAKGGRHCDMAERGYRCSREGCPSQPVFECSRCGEIDYGEPGGPGYEHCQDCARRAA